MKALKAYARRSVSLLAAWGCIVASTGCFSYLEIPSTELAPGTRVRAQLSTEGQVRLAPFLGSVQPAVEGEVVETDPQSLLLLTRIGVASGPTGIFLEQQRLQIEQREILRLEARHLQRGKTAAITVLSGGVLVGVTLWLFNARRSGTELIDVPPPENAILRWSFR